MGAYWTFQQTLMRDHLHGDITTQHIAHQLLCLEDGKFPVRPIIDLISFPSDFCTIVETGQELLETHFFLTFRTTKQTTQERKFTACEIKC